MSKIKDTAKKTKRILTNETVKFLFAHKSFLIVILYPLLPDFDRIRMERKQDFP